jgi:flagellar assembly factor FliW
VEVQTKFHGVIEIAEKDIVSFESGIPGFPDEDKFLILPLEEDGAFMILQSLMSPSLAFVIVNPFQYFPNYDFTLEDPLVEKLKVDSPEDVLVYTILTVQDPFEKTTANLQAPIIINAKKVLGKQVILNNEKYTTRHKILEKR